MTSRTRVLLVVNSPTFFLSHRLALAEELRRHRFDVHVATPRGDDVTVIEKHGFPWHEVALDRRSTNPLTEVRTVATLIGLYRRLTPDVVHHVTIKPIIYGTIAARIVHVPAVVNAVSGLGSSFLGTGIFSRALTFSVKRGYRIALQHPNSRIIFQNEDDRQLFVEHRLTQLSDTVLIRGSGVDTDEFHPTPEPDGVPVVLLPARMLRDKGTVEFVEAARKLRRDGVAVRMALCGPVDEGNRSALSREQLNAWVAEGVVEWWGYRKDMVAAIASCHVVCLPSYREGVPKALLEGAASGRPLITTDAPGCREVVRDGYNGFLVPVGDPAALATAVARFATDRVARVKMGQLSRARALDEFRVQSIVEQTVAVYRELLGITQSPRAGSVAVDELSPRPRGAFPER